MSDLGTPYIIAGRLARLTPLPEGFGVRFAHGANTRIQTAAFIEMEAAGTLMPVSESTYAAVLCQMNKQKSS
jgi:hypothetical protein